MAEQVSSGLDVYARFEPRNGRAVAHSVRADAADLGLRRSKLDRSQHIAWIHHRAQLGAKHHPRVAPLVARSEAFLQLLLAPRLQLGHHTRVKWQPSPRPICLRL